MKNTKSMMMLFALLAMGLSVATGCEHAHQNPLDYNNKLMTIMNKNTRDMQAMNAAMTSGDYQKATEVRQSWVSHLETALKKVNGLGGFHGDDAFQRAVLNGLRSYKKVVDADYKKLIAIRSSGNNKQPAKESELLNTINETFSHAGNVINQAAANFQTLYGK